MLFLVEAGVFVVLRKNGLEVAFSSLLDYKTASGIDLAGKNYVCYQPEDGYKIDDSQLSGEVSREFETQILSELEKIPSYLEDR